MNVEFSLGESEQSGYTIINRMLKHRDDTLLREGACHREKQLSTFMFVDDLPVSIYCNLNLSLSDTGGLICQQSMGSDWNRDLDVGVAVNWTTVAHEECDVLWYYKFVSMRLLLYMRDLLDRISIMVWSGLSLFRFARWGQR